MDACPYEVEIIRSQQGWVSPGCRFGLPVWRGRKGASQSEFGHGMLREHDTQDGHKAAQPVQDSEVVDPKPVLKGNIQLSRMRTWPTSLFCSKLKGMEGGVVVLVFYQDDDVLGALEGFRDRPFDDTGVGDTHPIGSGLQ